MVVVHRVFRRESALAPRLVRAVADGDTARATLVAAHLTDYVMGLRHHHSLEDELVWPLLHARAVDGELVDRMEEQHQRIDRSLAVVAEWLPAWLSEANPMAREELALALVEHHAVLIEHLDDEERLLLPLVADHLTVAEWDLVRRRGLEQLPRNKVLLALGAILEDATPQERADTLSKAPFVGRLLWRTVGRRRYAASCRVLRGVLHEEVNR
ncbi:hemerythrin domain-containing protein [Streptomyces sp. QTS52]